jgi:MFS family permease
MPFITKISPFVARLPVPARISVVLFFLASVADGALMPFFALWALKIAHVEVEWIGVLFACYAGGELVATPLIGGLADRIGRRRVLLFSSGGVGLGFILLLFAQGPWQAAACLTLIGVFESTLHPTAATVVADVFRQHAADIGEQRITLSIQLDVTPSTATGNACLFAGGGSTCLAPQGAAKRPVRRPRCCGEFL